jgi:hypothetical protein
VPTPPGGWDAPVQAAAKPAAKPMTVKRTAAATPLAAVH